MRDKRGFGLTGALCFLAVMAFGPGWAAPSLSNIKGLVGYPLWAEASPRIRLTPGEARPAKDLVLEMECPGASDFRITANGDFRDLPWRPLTPRLRWDLALAREVVQLTLVFRVRGNGGSRVSAPVALLLDRREPERILQGSPDRYIDWTMASVFAEGRASGEDGFRHDNGQARLSAERDSRAAMLEFVSELPLVYRTSARDLLRTGGGANLGAWQGWILRGRLDEVKGEGAGAMVRTRLDADGSGFPGAYGAWSTVLGFARGEEIPSHPHPAPCLLVDVRGLPYSPCFLPTLVDETGSPILTPGPMDGKSPWVRHFRAPQGPTFADWVRKQGGAKMPVLVKALALDRPLMSRILVTRRGRAQIEETAGVLEAARHYGWGLLTD